MMKLYGKAVAGALKGWAKKNSWGGKRPGAGRPEVPNPGCSMIVSTRIPVRLQEEFFKLNAIRCQAGKKILTRASIMCRLFAKFIFDEAFREDFLEQEQWMDFSAKCMRKWCKENPY